MFHQITQVYPTDDYKVYLYFSDGKIRLFDAGELVTKGVFQELKDKLTLQVAAILGSLQISGDLCGSYCGMLEYSHRRQGRILAEVTGP